MHPILEISLSTSFEKPTPLATQESRVETENSPFLKLLEEAKNSPPKEPQEIKSNSEVAEHRETQENFSEVEETISQTTEQEIENEPALSLELESDVSFLLPLRWEVSETLENDSTSSENQEKLEVEAALEIPSDLNSQEILELNETENKIANEFFEVSKENIDLQVSLFDTNRSEFQDSKDLQHNLISFQESKEEQSSVSITPQVYIEKNISFEEIKNTPLNFNLESQIKDKIEEFQANPKKIFTFKDKFENSQILHSQNSESNEKNYEPEKQKLSSDLLSILKDRFTFTKEEKLEKALDQNQLKQASSPNVKILVPKEEVPQVPEIKLTQNSEKENQTVLLTVQNVKSNSPKDANNKSAVYESSKPATQIFQNNTPEIVKTAKFQILENGKNFAIIELEPKELGKVLLQISMENDKVHGKLLFETESAKLIFQSELQNLKNELRIAGLEIDSLLIDLNNPEQDSKEFFAFKDSSNPQAIQEKPSQTEQESSEEISQTTKRLLDVRV